MYVVCSAFGSTSLTPELKGMMAVLRRGDPRWLDFNPAQIQHAYTLSPGKNRAPPLALAVPMRPNRACQTRKPKEKEASSESSNESSEDTHSEKTQETRGRLRVELEAANVKGQEILREVEALRGKVVAAEQNKLAAQGDVEAIILKCKRALEGRDRAVRKESRRACRSLAEQYGVVLDSVREKLEKKKMARAAEVALQEVRAKIDVLLAYQEGGFELEEELERLRQKEISCDINLGMASISNSSLRSLELPQVSGESTNQDVDDVVDQADS
ncbi:hypothetical protein Bca101_009829 [Brassica carinata]